MVDGSIGPYLGGPGNNLGWPGGFDRLALHGIVAMDFALHGVHHGSSETIVHSYVVMLGARLRDPAAYVHALRIINLSVFVLGMGLLAWGLTTATGDAAVSAAAVVLAASTALVWQRSLMATPDGPALGMSAAAAVAFSRGRLPDTAAVFFWRCLLCGGLFGAAVATKLPMVFVLPLLLIGCCFSNRRWFAGLCVWMLGCILLYGFINSYALNDPLRLLKAILGNVLTRKAHYSRDESMRMGLRMGLMLPAIAGAVVLVWFRPPGYRRLLLGAGSTVALFAAMTFRVTRVDPHYYNGLAIVCAVVIAVGFAGWRCHLANSRHRQVALGLGILWVLAAMLNNHHWVHRTDLAIAHIDQDQRRTTAFVTSNVFAAGKHSPVVAADMALVHYWKTSLSMNSMRRLAVEQEIALVAHVPAKSTLLPMGFSASTAVGLADLFNDYCRLNLERLRAMALAPPTSGGPHKWNVQSYGDSLKAIKTGLPTLGQMLPELARGHVDYLLSSSPVPGLHPTQVGGPFNGSLIYIYTR